MFTLQKRMARQKCKICPLKFVTACMSFSLKIHGWNGMRNPLPPPIIYLLCCKIATTIVTQLPLICFSVEIAAEIKNYVTSTNWKSQQNLNASNFIPSQCYMNLQSNNINIVFVINHSVLMKGLYTLCKFNIRLSYLIPFLNAKLLQY